MLQLKKERTIRFIQLMPVPFSLGPALQFSQTFFPIFSVWCSGRLNVSPIHSPFLYNLHQSIANRFIFCSFKYMFHDGRNVTVLEKRFQNIKNSYFAGRHNA